MLNEEQGMSFDFASKIFHDALNLSLPRDLPLTSKMAWC